MFKECMELEIDGMPPFFAAPAFIDNWYDGKDEAYEVDIPFRDKIVEEYKKGNYLLTGHDYLEVLKEFRSKDISEYMDSLIAKYHTEEEVAKHVTDDSLTHTLIENMIPKKERKKLTHEERIREATHRYMSGVDVEAIINTSDDKGEDDEIRESFGEWADDIFQVDSTGNVIVPDEEEEDDYFATPESEEEVHEVEACRVLYTRQECLVDLTGFGQEEFNKLVSITDQNAFYRLIVIKDGKIAHTDFKIGWIEDDIEEIFKKEEAATNG
jgi:hypothetical protein